MSLADEVQSRFDLARSAYPEGELEFMCDTVESLRPDCIFEWGTGSGASGRIFSEATHIIDDVFIPLVTVELPDELSPLESQHPRERTGQHLPSRARISALRGDGVTLALTMWATNFEGGYHKPLFFIDGDHSYFAVYREIALIDRMVPNAVIILHDTNDGPGLAAEKWVADQRRHTYKSIVGRTGIGRLDPK
jgi:cephalosporin hydroxylase